MKNIVRMIALDLDGTLLDTKKMLSTRNRKALFDMAERGIEVVPTTGRFFLGMPTEIRELPFLNYAITINGAQVYNIKEQTVVSSAEIPLLEALDALVWLDQFELIYDCYVDNWGWITAEFQRKAAKYVPDMHYLKMLQVLRTPVPELKEYLIGCEKDIQKIIIFTKTDRLQEDLLKILPTKFPNLIATSSAPHNIELNAPSANKGNALMNLAERLGIPYESTMAIGDGINDLSMIRKAGIGVAMENAHPSVKAEADFVTLDCDHDGVAEAIYAVLDPKHPT